MKSDRVATYFYVVVSDDLPDVAVRKDTLNEANSEAMHLARLNPGQLFVVCEAVYGHIVMPTEIEYVSAHNNPDDPNYLPQGGEL